MSTGWYDAFPAADTEYFAAMAAKNTAPQRLVVGPWSHVGMRGDATFRLDVDFGPQSVWGVQRYFEEQLAFFDRWLPDDAPGHAEGEAPVRIFVMGGGSGRARPEGKLDHGGRWRDEQEWPLARRVETTFYLHGDGSLSTAGAAAGAEPRRFTYDPAHPVPTIGGLYCAVGELPAEGEGMEPMWTRLLNPVLRLRNILTPGPGGPEGVARVLRLGGAGPAALRAAGRARLPDRAAGRAGRGDRPDDVHLWVSSSALDTDFTAKLIDVHPPNEDYPDGYDMLLNDSIIRCRLPQRLRAGGADRARASRCR